MTEFSTLTPEEIELLKLVAAQEKLLADAFLIVHESDQGIKEILRSNQWTINWQSSKIKDYQTALSIYYDVNTIGTPGFGYAEKKQHNDQVYEAREIAYNLGCLLMRISPKIYNKRIPTLGVEFDSIEAIKYGLLDKMIAAKPHITNADTKTLIEFGAAMMELIAAESTEAVNAIRREWLKNQSE